MREKLNKSIEVMNFAVRGYCTDQEVLLLMNEVIHYHPDMVMLSFCLNDLEDNYSKDGKPFYSLTNGCLILNNSPVSIPQKSKRTFDKKDPFRYLCQNSWFFEYIYTRVKVLRRFNRIAAFALNRGSPYTPFQDNDRLPESDYYRIDEPQMIIQRWLLFEEILKYMKGICDKDSIQFAVIGNVSKESTRKKFKASNSMDYSLPYRKLQTLCAELEIEYIDIMYHILKRKLRVEDIFHNEENFHYNILGNNLLAGILKEYVLKQCAFKVEW